MRDDEGRWAAASVLQPARWTRIWCFVLLVVCVGGCGESGLGHEDMSEVRVRGVVEGFYGPLYTFDQRRELFRFIGSAGMNTYVYAPKLDPYHREEWRAPYPSEYLEHFRDLAELGHDVGVRFVFAISPGLTFDPGLGDTEVLEAKLRSIFDVGVRDFCLFFDDIETGRPGADPAVQTDLVIEMRAFLRDLDAKTSLAFISNFYAGTAVQFAEDRSPFGRLFGLPSSTYFSAYQRIPVDVPIMWTGPAVFSERISVGDAADFHAYVGRPVWAWDNYPVNDALVMNELFLAPYEGRDARIGESLDGILVNPMLQAEATKIPLWTIGRFFRDGPAYDPDAALDEALTVVTDGQGTDVVRSIARHFRSHPFIGDSEESADLAAALAAFWESRSGQAFDDLRLHFAELAQLPARLDRDVANSALSAELSEPAAKLGLYGEAGVLALDLLAEQARGGEVNPAALNEKLQQAGTIRWLAGGNTAVPAPLAALVATRPARTADVFGDFFTRVLAELGV